MGTTSRSLILLTLAVAFAGSARAQTTSERTVQDGVFSEQQTNRGAKVFESVCQNCHLPDEFHATGYLRSWEGQTVRDLFDFIRTRMPFDNPGSLNRREYVDVVTYIMRLNGIRTGTAELGTSESELRAIKIVLGTKP